MHRQRSFQSTTTIPRSTSVMPMAPVRVFTVKLSNYRMTSYVPRGASGFVAEEAIEVSNVTVPAQAFGEHADASWYINDQSQPGVVTNSNVTLIDEVSGVLGLGFSRLSEIYAATPDGACFVRGVAAFKPNVCQPHHSSRACLNKAFSTTLFLD